PSPRQSHLDVNGETGADHEQRYQRQTACYGVSLFDGECGCLRRWLDRGFSYAGADAARLFLDTIGRREQLYFVGTAIMVHRPDDDAAFHPGAPTSLSSGRQSAIVTRQLSRLRAARRWIRAP